MDVIPGGNTVEVDLRQLRAFEVLLRERNLTRAATVLGVAQPALSKTLAKLRRYFADPLFVRAGHRMEPTAKALELAPAVHALLDDATMLRARHRPFDPTTSTRTFSFSVVDSGLVRLLPRLLSLSRSPCAGRAAARDADRVRGARGRARGRPPRFRDGLVSQPIEAHPPPDVVVRQLRQRRAPRSSAPRRAAVARGIRRRAARARVDGRHGARAPARRARARARAPGQIVCRVPTLSPPRTPRAARTSSRRCPPASRPSSATRSAFARPMRLPRIDVAIASGIASRAIARRVFAEPRGDRREDGTRRSATVCDAACA